MGDAVTAVVSRATAEALRTVMGFFGIDEPTNRHIFAAAAERDAQAFAVVVEALAGAVRNDARTGTGERIRVRIRAEKARVREQEERKREGAER